MNNMWLRIALTPIVMTLLIILSPLLVVGFFIHFCWLATGSKEL